LYWQSELVSTLSLIDFPYMWCCQTSKNSKCARWNNMDKVGGLYKPHNSSLFRTNFSPLLQCRNE
jgi:hypothetical protein